MRNHVEPVQMQVRRIEHVRDIVAAVPSLRIDRRKGVPHTYSQCLTRPRLDQFARHVAVVATQLAARAVDGLLDEFTFEVKNTRLMAIASPPVWLRRRPRQRAPYQSSTNCAVKSNPYVSPYSAWTISGTPQCLRHEDPDKPAAGRAG